MYQSLVTPHQKYNTGLEHLLGFWSDESMIGFEVNTHNNYKDAECDVHDMPTIDWEALVLHHSECYSFLRDHLSFTLKKFNIVVEYKHNLATPEQVKNRMFNRVLKGQEMIKEKKSIHGFRTVYDMNDIISFTIINPWSQNLHEIASRLVRTERLNIMYKIEKNNIIKLIGRTEIGTTYEIILTTSIMHNWYQWKIQNPQLSDERILSSLKSCIRSQKILDSTYVLR